VPKLGIEIDIFSGRPNPVIDVDNSSAVITDPRTADRGMYTQFTTFMAVMHGHIKIK
jgi:hypothetical protein